MYVRFRKVDKQILTKASNDWTIFVNSANGDK